jgi:hypothetical protein
MFYFHLADCSESTELFYFLLLGIHRHTRHSSGKLSGINRDAFFSSVRNPPSCSSFIGQIIRNSPGCFLSSHCPANGPMLCCEVWAVRRVRDLRIQVAPLIVSPILSRSKISRRGLARALLPSVVPELLIRSEIFAPGGWLSQECRGRDRQPRQHKHIVSRQCAEHNVSYFFSFSESTMMFYFLYWEFT